MTATKCPAGESVTAESIGLTYANLDSGESGSNCTFVVIGSMGLKVYNCRNSRNLHYWYQSELSELHRLAPDCNGRVDVTMPDGSVKYAYWTGIVECAIERYGNDYSNPQWRADRDELKDRLADTGYDWNDDSIENFGYDGDRPVLLDCGGY